MFQDTSIFGIGCSGTTVLYSLLQEIYHDYLGASFQSIYEPFIWDKQIFNCRYKDAGRFFGWTSSLSIEGMYMHKCIPMFIKDKNSSTIFEQDFFNDFSHHRSQKIPSLSKFIRANGRMSAFRQLNPAAKFILIIRNPLDSINCAKHKFSYFGEDFYPSDYPRFRSEVEKQGLLKIQPEQVCWANKQAEYCYQMTRAALDFATNDDQTIVIEYDQLKSNKSQTILRLGRFLNLDLNTKYLQLLESQIGPQTSTVSLSQQEYQAILPYEVFYRELCQSHSIKYIKSHQNVIHQYASFATAEALQLDYQEATTNQLRQVISRQVKKITELSRHSGGLIKNK